MEEMMFKKKHFKYSISIYVMYIGTFLTSFHLIGAYLVPFFTKWGGITFAQIGLLQGFFQIAVIPLEIPAGLLGDRLGKKFSVVLGMIFLSIGPVVYTWESNFWYFLAGELIFALVVALFSGADEGLFKSVLRRQFSGKELDLAQSEVRLMNGNFQSIGMIVGSFISPIVITLTGDYKLLFLLSIPFSLITAFLLAYGVENDVEKNSTLTPHYKKILNQSWEQIKVDGELRRLVIFLNIVGIAGYFVIWLNQLYMEQISIPESYWGIVRVFFLSSQVVSSLIFVYVVKKYRVYRSSGLIIVVSIVLLTTFSIFNFDTFGLIAFLIAGSLSLITRNLYSGPVNKDIPDEIQATLLSFIGVVRRITLGILGPLVGFLATKNLLLAMGFLVVCTITALFFLPRD